MILLIHGNNAGLTHSLATLNYSIFLSEKIKNDTNKNIIIYNNWKISKEFHNIINVNYSSYANTSNNSLKIDDFIEISKLAQKHNVSNQELLNTTTILNENNIILNAASTSGLPKNFYFFNIYKLQPIILEEISSFYSTLDNGNYTSVHFRGSDILKNKNIDYTDFLINSSKKIEDVIKNSSNKILLTSDNQDIISKYVDEKKVFSYSLVYDLFKKGIIIDSHQRLHCSDICKKHSVTEYDVLKSSVIDLFLMAHSKTLHADVISGFGQTANGLWRELQNNKAFRCL